MCFSHSKHLMFIKVQPHHATTTKHTHRNPSAVSIESKNRSYERITLQRKKKDPSYIPTLKLEKKAAVVSAAMLNITKA